MTESPTAFATDGSQNHADRMDRMYRYQRHIYDLSRKYYLLGRDHMIAGLD
ncbi:MAG: SAM-dependent methyltransferase, partial [Rhizobium sp.]|nr:SAM-dependent methyltransferase [Rhizobium sp.]